MAFTLPSPERHGEGQFTHESTSVHGVLASRVHMISQLPRKTACFCLCFTAGKLMLRAATPDPGRAYGGQILGLCFICPSAGGTGTGRYPQGAFPGFKDCHQLQASGWAGLSQFCSLSFLVLQALRTCLWCEEMFPSPQDHE